jgi:transcriptional repressor NrdR
VEEVVRMTVVKKDGSRVAFDRAKMLAGLQRACWKRKIAAESLAGIVEEVEELIFREYEREVDSRFIGAELGNRLLLLDKVAYMRFASVTEGFDAIEDFVDTARDMEERSRDQTPGQGELFG